MIVNRRKLLQAGPLYNMMPEKRRANGASWGLSEAGYDIRLKQDVLFTPATFHISTGQYTPGAVYVDGVHDYGNFTLASTLEKFDMPVDLVGVVHDKSTWARHGLSVFNTVIEPGWKGFLTLELVYHGRSRLHLPAGTGIAQVLFHKLEEHASYDGKYQDQADEPVAAVLE